MGSVILMTESFTSYPYDGKFSSQQVNFGGKFTNPLYQKRFIKQLYEGKFIRGIYKQNKGIL
jgi:hypothetical protein